MVSLYTSVNHDGGVRAVIRTLEKASVPIEGKELMVSLLELVLTSNYFKFGDKFYLQKQGTAMGTNMAPTYANMFLSMLEEE